MWGGGKIIDGKRPLEKLITIFVKNMFSS